MTSRPPAGTHREPQRSLSGTGTIQRPTAHRTLSQQYSSPASIRKSDNFVDLTLDGSESGRYGSPRVGGSRLKLELSRDSKEAPGEFESSVVADAAQNQHAARGRPRLRFEGDRPRMQIGNKSSLLPSIGGVENIIGHNAMPMPKRPMQSVLSSARGKKQPVANTVKKDLRPKPYILEVPPAAPHYLSDGKPPLFALLDPD
jgi:mediator of RNA polymerase II transcription subunit 12